MLGNGHRKYMALHDDTLQLEHKQLLQNIRKWLEDFSPLMQNLEPSWQGSSIEIVLANYKCIETWLESFLIPYETVWDQYKDRYEDILNHCARSIEDSVRFPDKLSKSFSFELGIIPALQFVTWKCRWPHVRRRALNLLQQAPKRECVFDSRYSFLLQERIINIEEESLELEEGAIPCNIFALRISFSCLQYPCCLHRIR